MSKRSLSLKGLVPWTLAALAAACLPGVAAAQAPLWTEVGSVPLSRMGFSLEVVGDYNGNGTDDVLIGEPGDNGGAFVQDGGSAKLVDGDGSCITIFYGPQAEAQMGGGLETLPDINGDGIDEILIGSHGSGAAPSGAHQGRVSLYLGGSDGGGQPGCLGSDYVPPAVEFDKGPAPPNTNTQSFGLAIASLGDIDGDGFPEFAVGAPMGFAPEHKGYVEVYSSSWWATGGTPVPEYVLSDAVGVWASFGASLTALDDVTGDGVDELVVGSPTELYGSPLSNSFPGRVRVYNGATGALLSTLSADEADFFGTSVEDVGDVDGDGYSDLAVGAPGNRPASSNGRTGSVHVYSGRLLGRGLDSPVGPSLTHPSVQPDLWGGGPTHGDPTALLMSLHGDELYRQLDSDGDGLPDIDSSVDGFGQSLANVGDLDGDGVAELLVGATGAWGWDPDWTLQGNWPDWYDGVGLGMARLVSLGTGLTIKQYFNDGGSSGDNYGFAVAGGGDFDGDGLPDFVISAAWEGPGNFGGVRTYSSDLRFGLVYGSGLPTSTGLAASLEATGQLSAAAGQLVMLGSNLPPNEMGLLIASTEQGPGQPVGDGLMFLAPGVGGIHRLGVFSSDANGDVRIELDLDALPFEAQPLPLDRWNYQLWFRDSTPGGFNFSDALTVGFY